MPTITKEARKIAHKQSHAPRGVRSPFIAALFSSALLWAAYFPLNLGFLCWIALTPFLSLIRSEARAKSIYLAAYLGGLLFFLTAIQWMRVADGRMYATWIGLSIYCACYFPLALWLLRRVDRQLRLPWCITVPVIWTALEYMRGHLMTGFSWYYLAHSQHAYLPLIQISDVAGTYAVTFLLASFNGLVAETYLGMRGSPKLQWAGVLLGCILVVLYGLWRLDDSQFTPGPRVALIQGNLDQRIRNNATANASDALAKIANHYFGLCDEAAERKPAPDLIIWPETSYPGDWIEISSEIKPDAVPLIWQQGVEACQDRARRLASRWRTATLLGLNTDLLEPNDKTVRFNSAVLFDREGTFQGRYDKMHRVPFGEYVPLKDWIPWMNALAPYDFDYSIRAGESFTRFPLGKLHFGVIICYEDTDSTLARRYVEPGPEPKVDFLVNISNDGWFDGTAEHAQHLAICRFRAVETRRAVVRAVNMGISAVIDGNGEVTDLPGKSWDQSKQIAAVLHAVVPLDSRRSLYAMWGDWLPWLCWFSVAMMLVGGTIRGRRKQHD